MATLTLDIGSRSLASALQSPATKAELEALLPAYISGQRWFAGKAHGIAASRIEHILPLSTDGSIVDLVVGVTDAAGAQSLYQLPLQAGESGNLTDPLEGASAASMRDLVLANDRTEADGVRLVTTHSTNAPACDGAPRTLGVEQSNSSVIFGQSCILKLFRLLQDGVNPDVELTAWLSGPGKFPNVAPVITSARLQAPGLDADALVLQEFVPNDGDGWSWVLARARGAFAAAPSPGDMHAYLAAERETLAAATGLGRLTAQLHAAFARADEPGIRPAPADVADWNAWGAELRREARDTATMLQPSDATTAGRLAAFANTDVPAAPVDLGTKTRIHGDYHLGQVLHASRGWVIIDFEGEPTRPLAERTALQHPLVDIAGLLRSWGYAAAVAGEGSLSIAAWEDAVTDACLAAYLEEASAHAFLPRDPGIRDALLRAFVLRKALYEVRYELGSRPDWISIPLRAVTAMLESTT